MNYQCFKGRHTIVMIKGQVAGFICEGFFFLAYKLEQCIHCWSIVFTHGVQMGGWALGKKIVWAVSQKPQGVGS